MLALLYLGAWRYAAYSFGLFDDRHAPRTAVIVMFTLRTREVTRETKVWSELSRGCQETTDQRLQLTPRNGPTTWDLRNCKQHVANTTQAKEHVYLKFNYISPPPAFVATRSMILVFFAMCEQLVFLLNNRDCSERTINYCFAVRPLCVEIQWICFLVRVSCARPANRGGS